MDEAFSFASSVPLRRRPDPRITRPAIATAVVLLGIGLFARWVVVSERESFSRAERRAVPWEVTVTQIQGAAGSTDADARDAIRIALTTARAASGATGSFRAADPARLSELQPGYTFVDGPSTTPRIVSVAARGNVWAAASLGPSGTCYWLLATPAGHVTRGSGGACTGAAALEAPVVGRGSEPPFRAPDLG